MIIVTKRIAMTLSLFIEISVINDLDVMTRNR